MHEVPDEEAHRIHRHSAPALPELSFGMELMRRIYFAGRQIVICESAPLPSHTAHVLENHVQNVAARDLQHELQPHRLLADDFVVVRRTFVSHLNGAAAVAIAEAFQSDRGPSRS